MKPTKYEAIRARYIAGLNLLPKHMHSGVVNYMENGIQPGGFLTAALSHDWDEAELIADIENLAALPRWKEYVSKYLPINSHGSAGRAIRDWCASLGLYGQENAERQDG